jgi:hypothetical protein
MSPHENADDVTGPQLNQPLNGTLRLNEIQVQALTDIPRNDLPIMEALVTAIGVSMIIAHFFIEDPAGVFLRYGLMLLGVVLGVLLVEMLVERSKAAKLLAAVRPMVTELEQLRVSIGEYLDDLDKRTSRYFHCVTNTKVTTYFMLRQLQTSLTELVEDLGEKLSWPRTAAYRYIRDRLRGSIEYRDGFEMSHGKLFHVPVARIPQTIQELIAELELGIQALESEISDARERVYNPEYGPPEKGPAKPPKNPRQF